jgi:hypothetical protein
MGIGNRWPAGQAALDQMARPPAPPPDYSPLQNGQYWQPPGDSWPAGQAVLDEMARRRAADSARQAAEAAQALQQQYAQEPGRHPPNAAFVSDDGLVSYDAQGYRLDHLGNRAFGEWPRKSGNGTPGSSKDPAKDWKWGTATAAPTPWWLPGLGGDATNPWGAAAAALGLPPNAGGPGPAADDPFKNLFPNGPKMPPMAPPPGTPDPKPNPPAPAPPAAAPPPVPAPPVYPPGMTPQAGIPNWAQPNYNQSPYQALNEEQWRRNLEAAAGIYFPLMNYMQGADQFNRTLAEQIQNNRWSQGFQDRTWNSEFVEGNRRYEKDFGESARRYGQDFGESKRRFDTELDQRKREAAWQRTADAYNITGRAVLPRARFVSYR